MSSNSNVSVSACLFSSSCLPMISLFGHHNQVSRYVLLGSWASWLDRASPVLLTVHVPSHASLNRWSRCGLSCPPLFILSAANGPSYATVMVSLSCTSESAASLTYWCPPRSSSAQDHTARTRRSLSKRTSMLEAPAHRVYQTISLP